MKKIRITIALLLTLCMMGTAVSCFADAERVCNSNGEIIVRHDDGNGGYTDEPMQGTTLNEPVTSKGGQNSLIGSDAAVSALNSPKYNQQVPVPAGSEMTANDDVSCEGDWIAGGAKAVADQGYAAVTVNGDVFALSYTGTYHFDDQITGQSGDQTSSYAYGASAHSDGSNSVATVTVNGDISAEARGKEGIENDSIIAQGVLATAVNDGTSNATVTGNVKVKSERDATGVDVRGEWGSNSTGNSNIDINVGGSVSAEGKAIQATGLAAGTYGPMSNTTYNWNIEIGGDVSAKNTEATYEMTAIEGMTYMNPTVARGADIKVQAGQVEAEIKGNVTADGKGMADGVYLQAGGNGSISVGIGKDVTASAVNDQANGLNLQGSGNGDIDLKTGAVTATSTNGTAAAVQMSIGENADAHVEIKGKVEATTTNGIMSTGIQSTNGSGETFLQADGDITVKGGNMTYGLNSSNEAGKVTFIVNGRMNVSGEGFTTTGIKAATYDKDAVTGISLTGNLNVESETQAASSSQNDPGAGPGSAPGPGPVSGPGRYAEPTTTGTDLTNMGGTIKVAVAGDVSVEGENASALKISNMDTVTSTWLDEQYTGEIKEEELVREDVYEWDGEIYTYGTYYNEELDVWYDSYGNQWKEEKTDLEGSSTSLTVLGNVTSDGEGLSLSLESDQITTDILVDGTLSGEERSITLTEKTTVDNLTLTVWQVKENEDGAIVSRAVTDEQTGLISYEQDKEAEKAIQYIIRIEEESKDNITSDARTYGDYKVANEGERVTLKLAIPEGYKLVGVYGTEAKDTLLLTEDDGNYYLDVPRGGGVLLSVKLEEEEPVQPEEPETTEETNTTDETQTQEPEPEAEQNPEQETEPEQKTEPKQKTRPETNLIIQPVTAAETQPAAQAAAQQNNAAVQQNTATTKVAIMKPADETTETTTLKDLVENNGILNVLPDEIREQLPEGVSTVAATVTMTLENYDETMGAVTLKIAPKKTYTKGEKATVVIALPDGNGGYTYFYIEGEGQEDGTLNLNIPADTAKALAGKTFVTMILE